MNKYIILISFFLTSTIFAQNKKNIIEETFDKIKNDTKVDKKDLTCYNLTQKMYNEVLCFVEGSMLADSLRLRNRQLLVAANR